MALKSHRVTYYVGEFFCCGFSKFQHNDKTMALTCTLCNKNARISVRLSNLRIECILFEIFGGLGREEGGGEGGEGVEEKGKEEFCSLSNTNVIRFYIYRAGEGEKKGGNKLKKGQIYLCNNKRRFKDASTLLKMNQLRGDVMPRNVSLEAASLLRLEFTTLLRACMPCYANIVNISNV
jgi:hypothetical protein